MKTIYIDGSYSSSGKHPNHSGWAVVVTTDGVIDHAISGRVPHSGVWNIAGEMTAAVKAVEHITESQIVVTCDKTKWIIVYDYTGIEAWITGAWKTKKDITRRYAEKMSELLEFAKGVGAKVVFKQIKGHIGNKFHDVADKLAKEAIGIE